MIAFMGAESNNGGVFEAVDLTRQPTAVAKREKTVERLGGRILGAASRGERQLLIRGGRFGLMPTAHTLDVYADLVGKLQAQGVGVAIMRVSSELPAMVDPSSGTPLSTGQTQVFDEAFITRFNGQDYAMPEELAGTQIYPPPEK